MTTTLKIAGITDEVTTCECCGRSDLKSTVVVTDGEGEFYFGSQCAAKALGFSLKQVNRESSRARKAEAGRKDLEERARRFEESARYEVWKIATYGDAIDSLDRFRRYRQEVA